MALHGKATLKALQAFADKQTPFRIGNISGVVIPANRNKELRYGIMPFSERYRYKLARELADELGIDTAVFYSWETPIAWTLNGEWVFSEEDYSDSTKGHISRFRVAVDNPGFWNR